jgi:thiamine biosynthesis lipoprotein
MKQTRLLMGMPITVEIVDERVRRRDIDAVYDYFTAVDNRFSTYKPDSEISRINAGLDKSRWSKEMKTVLQLCDETKRATGGYFDIEHGGRRDPSGLVKGWAIQNAAELLKRRGFQNFYVEAGGDIQTSGLNTSGELWTVGIRNPLNREEIIKTVQLSGQAIATSGTAIRGQHIYNPRAPGLPYVDVLSISVVGPNIYDTDRFATAAFAMGKKGIAFIEVLPDYEAYMVGADQTATLTSGFANYQHEAIYA